MQPYGQARALGLKATAAVNNRKRHRCGLDAQDHRDLGDSYAVASKGRTRRNQRRVERAAAKRHIRQELWGDQ